LPQVEPVSWPFNYMGVGANGKDVAFQSGIGRATARFTAGHIGTFLITSCVASFLSLVAVKQNRT
jgi:hypothetical protein